MITFFRLSFMVVVSVMLVLPYELITGNVEAARILGGGFWWLSRYSPNSCVFPHTHLGKNESTLLQASLRSVFSFSQGACFARARLITREKKHPCITRVFVLRNLEYVKIQYCRKQDK